ncbi:MAG: hypothetical protein EBE86_024160 [Hormoscilla sp. GUM202]|nr:hypothetical protein [Hormoscilla sp. GUM202]
MSESVHPVVRLLGNDMGGRLWTRPGEQLPRLLAVPWIQVASPNAVQLLLNDDALRGLGAGEQEAIALALEIQGSVLLINDNQARRLATGLGVSVVNIPAFLSACKIAGLLNTEAMGELITSLQQKDYYRFRQDVLDLLMS